MESGPGSQNVNLSSGNLLATRCRSIQKRWEAALADFNKAIELQPPGMPAVFERARLYVHTGELDRALEDLDKILAGPVKSVP